MSRADVAKKIQRKAARRAKRKLPVAKSAAAKILEPLADLDVINGESTTFDPVKDSSGGE